jgi:hypothetical protein
MAAMPAAADADGAGTVADLGFLAVLDEPAVGPGRGVCPRGELGILDVDAADPDHRLDKDPPAQCRRHIVVNELRAVPEHQGDDPGGLLDAVDGKIHSPHSSLVDPTPVTTLPGGRGNGIRHA